MISKPRLCSLATATIFFVSAGGAIAGDDHHHAHEKHHGHDGHEDHRHHDAHVHGLAELGVAIEGTDLEVSLESPLANFLGFEHAPQNPAEKKAFKALKAQLQKPDDLFIINKTAQCALQSVEVEFHGLDEKDDEHDDHHGHGHHGDHHESDSHADMEAYYSYTCSSIGALDVIGVTLFERYPNFETIEAVLLTGTGQYAQSLTAASPSLNIK